MERSVIGCFGRRLFAEWTRHYGWRVIFKLSKASA